MTDCTTQLNNNMMRNTYFHYVNYHCDHNMKPQSNIMISLLLTRVITALSNGILDAGTIVFPAISTEPYQPRNFNFPKRFWQEIREAKFSG